MCEALAAHRSPGYSYVGDFISDLGVDPLMVVGSFMVHGVLFGVGAVLAVAAARRSTGRFVVGDAVFLAAALANSGGNILVGAFASGESWHVVGAGLAIVGGNLAAVTGGLRGGALGAGRVFTGLSVTLGAFGLGCLLVLVVDGLAGQRHLPAGFVERGAVYPILAWEVLAAMMILWRCRAGSAARSA